jgi:hypothetical protein
MMTFFTVEQIKQANAEAGQHWFDPGALRFFSSRVSGPVVGGRYFISSEKFTSVATGLSDPRKYTIRVADDDGSIDTVGEFQQYTTKRAALTAARALD